MRVESCHTLAAFETLQSHWSEVHARDPHATLYTSWAWLHGWLSAAPTPWTVLVVRSQRSAAPVAFLALALKPQGSRFRRSFLVRFAGSPMTNHTGLVCLHEVEDAVIAALARFLQHQRSWRTFSLRQTCDLRVARLVALFPGADYRLEHDTRDISPVLELPATYEAYLAAQFSSKTRKRMRRQERQAEDLGCTVTAATPQTLEAHLDAFLHLHQLRWGAVEARYLALYRELLRATCRAGTLYLRVMWCGGRPIAAEVGFEDRPRGVFYAFQGGWDPDYADISPGQLMMQANIRYAIEAGFRALDYGKGTQTYKFDLGARPADTHGYLLRRRGLRERLGSLAPAADLGPAHSLRFEETY